MPTNTKSEIVHVWSVLCEKAIIDKDNNNVSIFNVIEQLTLPDQSIEPNTKVQLMVDLCVVTLWTRGPSDTNEQSFCRVRVLSPTNKVLRKTNELTVDLTKHKRSRIRFVFDHLPYVGLGTYHYQVQLKVGNRWKSTAKIPLEIASR